MWMGGWCDSVSCRAGVVRFGAHFLAVALFVSSLSGGRLRACSGDVLRCGQIHTLGSFQETCWGGGAVSAPQHWPYSSLAEVHTEIDIAQARLLGSLYNYVGGAVNGTCALRRHA